MVESATLWTKFWPCWSGDDPPDLQNESLGRLGR